MTVAYWLPVILYLCNILIFNNNIIPVKNHDGSIANYRQNIIKLYVFASDETYNAHFNTFFFVEACFIVTAAVLFIAFDILLVSLSLAICCQLQVVNSAFESVGHKSFQDHITRFGEYRVRGVLDLHLILPKTTS